MVALVCVKVRVKYEDMKFRRSELQSYLIANLNRSYCTPSPLSPGLYPFPSRLPRPLSSNYDPVLPPQSQGVPVPFH